MKRLLITGATGYLGSSLVQHLTSGFEIAAIVLDKNNLDYLPNIHSNINIIEIKDTNFENFVLDFSPNYIIHTAAKYEKKETTLSELIDANYVFPCRILDIIVKLPNKIHWINTNTSLKPAVNFYALTKHQFAEIGKQLCDQEKITFTNILLEQFFGPNDSGEKFIPFLLNKMLKNESIPLTDGTQKRDFIYIDDVISAYKTILNSDIEGYHDISLGTGIAPQVREVVLYLKQILDSKSQLNFGNIEKRPNEPNISIANISAMKKLQWNPQYSWQKGLSLIKEGLQDA